MRHLPDDVLSVVVGLLDVPHQLQLRTLYAGAGDLPYALPRLRALIFLTKLYCRKKRHVEPFLLLWAIRMANRGGHNSPTTINETYRMLQAVDERLLLGILAKRYEK